MEPTRSLTVIASIALLVALAGTGHAGAPPSVGGEGAAPNPGSVSDVRRAFQAIARVEALHAGLPFDLVDAVMKIESGYRPEMIGAVGEIGLMQVRPATASMLGFKGLPGSLADPATNIHYGAVYLGEAWRLAKGDVCRTLMKYRAGHGEEVMTPLSATYCAHAKAHLVAIHSPLADRITAADLAAAPPSASLPEPGSGDRITTRSALPSLRTPSGRPKVGAAFWAAFKARIGRANAKIEAKWARRVASR